MVKKKIFGSSLKSIVVNIFQIINLDSTCMVYFSPKIKTKILEKMYDNHSINKIEGKIRLPMKGANNIPRFKNPGYKRDSSPGFSFY